MGENFDVELGKELRNLVQSRGKPCQSNVGWVASNFFSKFLQSFTLLSTSPLPCGLCAEEYSFCILSDANNVKNLWLLKQVQSRS